MSWLDFLNPWRTIRRLMEQNAKLRAANHLLRRDIATITRNRHGLEQSTAKLSAENARLRIDNRLFQERSEYDTLTGARNRHGLEQAVTLALETLASQHLVEDTDTLPLLPMPSLGFIVSVLFIDLDHFKDLNDAHQEEEGGHKYGDKALQGAFQIIHSCFRDISGLTGRWGGDEFVVVLPCIDQDVALSKAEMVRKLIKDEFLTMGGITASIGVSSFFFRIGDDPRKSLPEWVAITDKAMYAAKRSGKNRVCRLSSVDSFDRRR